MGWHRGQAPCPKEQPGDDLAYIGHPAYGPDALRTDLDRFIFLLGVSDGEDLFGSQYRHRGSSRPGVTALAI